jgi:hypothetical protein
MFTRRTTAPVDIQALLDAWRVAAITHINEKASFLDTDRERNELLHLVKVTGKNGENFLNRTAGVVKRAKSAMETARQQQPAAFEQIKKAEARVNRFRASWLFKARFQKRRDELAAAHRYFLALQASEQQATWRYQETLDAHKEMTADYLKLIYSLGKLPGDFDPASTEGKQYMSMAVQRMEADEKKAGLQKQQALKALLKAIPQGTTPGFIAALSAQAETELVRVNGELTAIQQQMAAIYVPWQVSVQRTGLLRRKKEIATPRPGAPSLADTTWIELQYAEKRLPTGSRLRWLTSREERRARRERQTRLDEYDNASYRLAILQRHYRHLAYQYNAKLLEQELRTEEKNLSSPVERNKMLEDTEHKTIFRRIVSPSSWLARRPAARAATGATATVTP